MADTLVPPLWLLATTATCFLVFFAFFGDETFDTNLPENPSLGDLVTGGISFFGDVFDFVTFGAFDDDVTLPAWVQVPLFLFCTLPWILLMVQGAIQIIGLIPFFLLVTAAGGLVG